MADTQREPLYRLLRSGVQGEVFLPGDSWSSDFGGVVRKTPGVVVRPQHEQDIFHCFSVAKEMGVPFPSGAPATPVMARPCPTAAS